MRLTKTGTRFTLAISGLSVAHHVDHVLRGVTGWPLAGGFNSFTVSLFIYPSITIGLLLSRQGFAGPRFWAVLAATAALFVLADHVGPTASDPATEIPRQHNSHVTAIAALVVLTGLLSSLIAHCLYEGRVATWTSAK